MTRTVNLSQAEARSRALREVSDWVLDSIQQNYGDSTGATTPTGLWLPRDSKQHALDIKESLEQITRVRLSGLVPQPWIDLVELAAVGHGLNRASGNRGDKTISAQLLTERMSKYRGVFDEEDLEIVNDLIHALTRDPDGELQAANLRMEGSLEVFQRELCRVALQDAEHTILAQRKGVHRLLVGLAQGMLGPPYQTTEDMEQFVERTARRPWGEIRSASDLDRVPIGIGDLYRFFRKACGLLRHLETHVITQLPNPDVFVAGARQNAVALATIERWIYQQESSGIPVSTAFAVAVGLAEYYERHGELPELPEAPPAQVN